MITAQRKLHISQKEISGNRKYWLIIKMVVVDFKVRTVVNLLYYRNMKAMELWLFFVWSCWKTALQNQDKFQTMVKSIINNLLLQPSDISANRYTLFIAFIWVKKVYKSFRWTLYMVALFSKKWDMEAMNYSKSVLMKGLIYKGLFETIYLMHAVLNLLIIREKKKLTTSFCY